MLLSSFRASWSLLCLYILYQCTLFKGIFLVLSVIHFATLQVFTSFLKRDMGLELDEARKFVKGLSTLPKEALIPADLEATTSDALPFVRRNTGDAAAPRRSTVRLSSTN